MSKTKKCLVLFWTLLTISSTANSGYAILSVVSRDFTRKYRWITEEEMQDYIALIQGSPGPMAINISLVTGYHIAGVWGAFAAALGCILPPIVMMLLVSLFYGAIVSNSWVRVFLRGMQAGVIAMLADLILGVFLNVTKEKKVYPLLVMAAAFLFTQFTKLSTLPLVAACILTGCLMYLWDRRKGGGEQ